jgi:hypothetical protein
MHPKWEGGVETRKIIVARRLAGKINEAINEASEFAEVRHLLEVSLLALTEIAGAQEARLEMMAAGSD